MNNVNEEKKLQEIAEHNEGKGLITQDDKSFIQKYGFYARLIDNVLKIITILLLGMLVSTAIPGIIFSTWNGNNNTEFMSRQILITCIIIGILLIAMIVCKVFLERTKTKLKVQELLKKESKYQGAINKQTSASSTIMLVNTIGNLSGEAGVGTATVGMIGAYSVTKQYVVMAQLLEKLAGIKKKNNYPLLLVIVAFMAFIVSTIIGVNASLKDKKEIIETREEVINAVTSSYSEFNPKVDDYYHNKGYYVTPVRITLDNDSEIYIDMLPHGMGKITKIYFEVSENLSNIGETETAINTLVDRLTEMYQKTYEYKNYYKDLFNEAVPEFKMDVEHQNELVNKLDKLISEDDDNKQEYQEQYHQTNYKTAIKQDLIIKYKKSDNNKVTLRLSIKEHKMQ